MSSIPSDSANHGIHSIALPALGCGNGGLEWLAVRSRIEQALGSLKGVEVTAYEPVSGYHGSRES